MHVDENNKIIFVTIILIIVLLVILSPFIFINIKLIGNNIVNLDYGEKYSEPGFRAYMFNREITDKIKVRDNIKEDLGKYSEIFLFDFIIP